ncbi:hypothetical protein HMPREF9418_0373 [Neisseria macacae ATCC 33926]|uniref:Uncharacterized protein n=1 Tax=Neisseria macacae ATCC 33926 TaxID=997348 RepID=A0AA36XLK8_9NEIS|nr:hypothetical protein HMPREF9418_0373 [Neisseria macacae ATCC 33926]
MSDIQKTHKEAFVFNKTIHINYENRLYSTQTLVAFPQLQMETDPNFLINK